MFSFMAKLFRASRPVSSASSLAHRRRVRPGIEALEDRRLLSNDWVVPTIRVAEGVHFGHIGLGRVLTATAVHPSPATIDWGDGSPKGTLEIYDGHGIPGFYGYALYSPQHKYMDAGTKTVTISFGKLTTTTQAIVSDAPLLGHTTGGSANIFTPVIGVEGQEITLTVARGVHDSTGNDPLDHFTATISWGDDTPDEVGKVTPTTSGVGKFDVQGSHTYARAGDYMIKAVISSIQGASIELRSSFRVVDAPLKGTAQPRSVRVGQEFQNFAVATFTDETPNTTPDEYSARINWADGTVTDNARIEKNSDGSFSVLGTHRYRTSGPKPITVTITEVGGRFGQLPYTVIVKNDEGRSNLHIHGMVSAIQPLPDIKAVSVDSIAANQFRYQYSTSDFAGKFAVSLYQSTSPVFNPCRAKLLATQTASSKNTSGVFHLPQQPAPGHGPYFFVMVDSKGAIVEESESNNVTQNTKTAILTPDGTLWITGTGKRDTIFVSQDAGQIRVHGTQIYLASQRRSLKSVSAGAVKKIHVESNDGNDVIRLDRGREPLKASAYIAGGAGNDTIFGAIEGRNVIHGGADQDTIHGGGLNDELYGGAGADYLFGKAGHDRLFGDADSDSLWGGAGDDWLEAGSAAEAAYGGELDEVPGTESRRLDRDFNAHVWAIGPTNKGFHVEDIHQTYSLSCSFLSSLGALAQANWNLADHISYEGNFKYKVRLFAQTGEEQLDYQLVDFDGARIREDPFSLTTAETREFWADLFHRAYDKQRHGNERGTIEEALKALTGTKPEGISKGMTAPPEQQIEEFSADEVDDTSTGTLDYLNDIRFTEDHRKLLFESLAKGLTGAAGTYKNGVANSNLLAEHAYTILGLTADGRSIKLRNPHGDLDLMNDGGFLELTWEEFDRDMVAFAIHGTK